MCEPCGAPTQVAWAQSAIQEQTSSLANLQVGKVGLPPPQGARAFNSSEITQAESLLVS